MKKHIFIIVLCLIFPMAICAQSIRQQVGKKETKTVVKTQTRKPIGGSLTQVKPKTEPDTVYCLKTKKQHGWFSPMQIVSKDLAMHYGSHYRFTRKNAVAHWTKMEVLDGYGRLRPDNGMAPYILNIGAEEHDKSINRDWLEKVKTECVYEFIADPSGENVIQERAFDKWHNLVYSYSRVQIGNPEDRKYIGSYRDYYGLPAEMRNDSAYTYGTLVVITEDRWGNDSIIQYVDAKGVPKNNSWGVAQEHYIQDHHGLLQRKQSCDIEGNRVIDLAGNCAWQANWNTKTYTLESQICLDDKLQPMRMPDVLGYGNETVGTIKQVYKYDDYKRQIETKFVTIDNKPDTNIYGAHRIEFTWDDYGNRTSVTAYDIDGKLAAFGKTGTARWTAEYDEKGRMKYIEWYDKNNQLCSTEGYLSRKKEIYGDDDYLDEQVYWAIENGKEDTCYYYKRTHNSCYERYNDGSYKIDSLDNKGRKVLTVYYKADGTPEFNKKTGYHRLRIRITESDKKSLWNYEYTDTLGNLCGKYPVMEYSIDSVQWTMIHRYYNNKKRLSLNLRQQYTQGFSKRIREIDENQFGNICRSGGVGTLYYYADILKNQKDEYTAGACRDEFGESDYNSTPCYYIRFTSKGVANYDENNNRINDNNEFRNSCPKAMSIEVTDSSAYRLGLQDNDIILCYGDSYQIKDSLNYWNFVGAWSVSQCIEAQKEKNLLVFRINPITKEYGVVSLTLPKGNPSHLGFIAHPTFKTQKQVIRIKESIAKYREQCAKDGTTCLWKDLDSEEKIWNIVVAFPDMYMSNRNEPYPLQVTDPSIILAFNVPTMKRSWLFGQNAESLSSITSSRKDSQEEHPIIFYFTKDGQNLDNKHFTERLIGFSAFNYKVTTSQYRQFLKLAKQVKKQIRKDY